MERRVIVTMLVMMGFFVVVSYLYPLIFPPPPAQVAKTGVPAAPEAGAMTGEPLPRAEGAVADAPAGALTGTPEGTESSSLAPGAPTPTTLPDRPTSPAPPAQPTPAAIEEFGEATVDTPLFRAVFSEEGGRLKSFKLKRYDSYKIDPDLPAGPQELVNAPANNPADNYPFNLVYSGRGTAQEDLRGLRFAADKKTLDLAGPGGTGTLTMTAVTRSGLTITRVFSFDSGSYLVRQKVTLANQGAGSYDGTMGMMIYSWPYSRQQSRYNAVAAYANGSLYSETVDDAKEELADIGRANSASFLGYMDQYFLSAFLFGGDAESPVPGGNPAVPGFSADEMAGNGIRLGAHRPLRLTPGSFAEFDFDVYYGPKDNVYLRKAGHNLNKSVDLGWFSVIAIPLGWLLRLAYGFAGNYGVAIILVTILIKLLLWPLTAKSYRSMKAMQKLSPQIKKIREKHKNDPQTMNREMMQLYKTFKVSPLGGCLPMILQIPFFFAFYRVLDYALELRGAPFVLWITDLSAPDRLFHFNVSIPLVSQPTGIPVLTLLMGATMIWQQKMTPTMGDPMQAKIMMFLPLIFIVALLNMPSGLVLYWLVNNILSIFQQKLINRPDGKKTAAVAATAGNGGKGKK
ncbi:MAG: membrane protein insertase YidC [Deltaproteobacteria bacterium]|jgi:YidC/Oxa1 family membrane protein insertase|nr:membrane protein insertase YidC [Deltaproteobacteria bacterium]